MSSSSSKTNKKMKTSKESLPSSSITSKSAAAAAAPTAVSGTALVAKQLQQLLKPISEERADAARLDDLRRLFAEQELKAPSYLHYSNNNNNNNSKSSSSLEALSKWNTYLQKQRQVFIQQLLDRMKKEQRKTAVRTLWGVLAAHPVYTSPPSQSTVVVGVKQEQKPFAFLNSDLLQLFLAHLPHDLDKTLTTMIQQEFLMPYYDVQYYAHVAVARLAQEEHSRIQNNNNKNKKTKKNGRNKDATKEAQWLFQLLTMIPRVKSQKELDEGTGTMYLFEPPTSGTPLQDDDEEDDDHDDEEDVSVKDDDEEEDTEESDDEEGSKRPTKKLKTEPPKPRVFPFQQVRAHSKVAIRAWLAVLKLPLPPSSLKHALLLLPTQVLPYAGPHALRFADFFVKAMDHGGIISVLALDGLFLLMMEHGLEYPSFYSALYKLVSQPALFHVKYRVRFFELLTKCLVRNEMLPAHVVAAFVKRLCQCALYAPPSACLFALALCSNLLRKHAECACLIHRSRKASTATDGADTNTSTDIAAFKMMDKFNATTHDPAEACALESSLWELNILEQHYFPAVAAMASSVGREDATPNTAAPYHDITNDFLSHTYKSLFDQERKRLEKKKKKIPLAFTKPTSLFTTDDVFDGMLNIGTAK